MLLKGPLCIRKCCSKLHLRMVYSKEKPNFKYLRVSKSKLPELWSKVQWFCTNSVLTSFGITCPDGAQRFCLLLTLCCICLRLFGSRQVIFFCWLVPLISWLRYLYRCTLVQVSHWQYCGLLLAWNIKIGKIINKQDTEICLTYLVTSYIWLNVNGSIFCTKNEKYDFKEKKFSARFREYSGFLCQKTFLTSSLICIK